MAALLRTKLPYCRFVPNLFHRGASGLGKKFAVPRVYKDHMESIWDSLEKFADEHKPLVNVGDGCPNFPPPDFVICAMVDAVKDHSPLAHQYTRGKGHKCLVETLAKWYCQFIKRRLDPMNEILVTSGAFESLSSIINGHIRQGDEVIIIEPCFASYEMMVKVAGGKPVCTQLKPSNESSGIMCASDWKLDMEHLECLFNEKTKAIIINNPSNPLGKVYTMEELTCIANMCKKWNVMCISDEVYEWIVYEPNKLIRMVCLPDMWERTVTIGSAGKTLHATGWKIGWMYGPCELLKNASAVHSFVTNKSNTPTQVAVAKALESQMSTVGTKDSFQFTMNENLKCQRDSVVNCLAGLGFRPTVPDAGYFVVANYSALAKKATLDDSDPDITAKYKDERFVKWLCKNIKVLTVPITPFYCDCSKECGENYIRFCFVKTEETLQDMDKLLRKWLEAKKC